MNWSGGKDSALALYHLLREQKYDVKGLLTSVNTQFDRISIHGVRRSLLEKQAESIGIPLDILAIPGEISMEDYGQIMTWKMSGLIEQGFTKAAFGDIFLEDLRNYRESKLAESGVSAIFPLWKRNTTELVREFIDLGFRAITVCVDAKFLDESFVGREINEEFLKDLPANVDPCGENGEFHSFVFDGPIFKLPVQFEIGDVVNRTHESTENATWGNSFWYGDLVG